MKRAKHRKKTCIYKQVLPLCTKDFLVAAQRQHSPPTLHPPWVSGWGHLRAGSEILRRAIDEYFHEDDIEDRLTFQPIFYKVNQCEDRLTFEPIFL
jgi:hypothetical protein